VDGSDCTDVDEHGTVVEILDYIVQVLHGAIEVFAGAGTEAAGDLVSAFRFRGVGEMTSSSLSSTWVFCSVHWTMLTSAEALH